MGKKKGGHKMPAYRKWLKAGVTVFFKILGVAAITGPAVPAVQNAISKQNVDTLGQDTLYNYTGIGISGGTSINWGQTAVGIGAVAGGLFLFWIGGQAARHV